jgi:hypothetical protein
MGNAVNLLMEITEHLHSHLYYEQLHQYILISEQSSTFTVVFVLATRKGQVIYSGVHLERSGLPTMTASVYTKQSGLLTMTKNGVNLLLDRTVHFTLNYIFN